MSTNNVCGNAAAMHEALKRIGAMEVPHNFQAERSDIADACYDLTAAIKLARSALAAPERNCDRYATPDAAERAFDDYCHDRRENPVEVCRRKSCRDCQREWLYAAAKEQVVVDA